MRTSRVLGAAVVLCTISSALFAQGWIDPVRPVPQLPNGPGETRKITLKYTQLLDRAGDAWRFRYLGDRNRQTAPRSFRLEVDSAARFGDPYSPTHQVQVTRRDNHLEVTLAEGSAATGDFELLLPLARGLIGLSR